jgi:hypothetical protein
VRAAVYYGRAAEAACAQGADNLVQLDMQLEQANALLNYAVTAAEAASDPRIYVARSAECVALFSGAVEARERRRVAGTLLEGTCAAAEEAWQTTQIQRSNAHMTAGEAASAAALWL